MGMWRNIVAIVSPFDLCITVPVYIMLTCYWTFGLAMLYVDLEHRPKAVYMRKIQHQHVFKFKGGPRNPPLINIIIRALLGQVVMVLALWVMRASKYVDINSSIFDTSAVLPSVLRIVMDNAFFFAWESATFFVVHRLLHTRWLYANVHYIHHQFLTPIALGATYAHPIEQIFGNAMPAVIGPLLFWIIDSAYRPHVISIYVYTLQGMHMTLSHHSGYDLKPLRIWGDPRASQPRYHDNHHANARGNYGNFGFLDWMFKSKLT
jgi:sterol desaturase/sphingolipid hydroxylase (fatty acid hydroxylase superfamily)